jgi:hypothetical protein
MHALLQTALVRRVAMLLVAVMTLLAFAPRVEAGFVPTGLSQAAVHAQDLAVVQKTLEHKAVTERLAALGYSKEEVSSRLAMLSDDERHRLAGQLDALGAGGDGLGIVLALVIIVLLVVLILKIEDKTITIH